MNFDYQLFGYANALVGKSRIFDGVVVFFGRYAIYLLALALVLLWLLAKDKLKTRQALLSAFLGFILARFILTELIRLAFHRARPFLAHQVVQLIPKDAEQSFPSGHAAATFAIAMGIYFYHKKLGLWLFILAVVVSVARVIAGVHYPSDILGGAVVGVLSAWLVEAALKGRLAIWAKKFSEITDKIFRF